MRSGCSPHATVYYKSGDHDSLDETVIIDNLPINMVSLTQSYGKFSSSSSTDFNSIRELPPVNDIPIAESSENHLKVEIVESYCDSGINITTTTLRICKRKVLLWYWRLLMFVGWRRFGHDSMNSNSCVLKLINFLYTSLVILLLLYAYVYSTLFCQWKLNIHSDVQAAVSLRPTNVTKSIPHSGTFQTTDPNILGSTGKAPLVPSYVLGCHHILSTYIIPHLCHLIVYCIGFYYFRIQESEQLYALMEKVFLQASPLQGASTSQKRVIRTLRIFLVAGLVWVILSIVENLLYYCTYDHFDVKMKSEIGIKLQRVLMVIELFGNLLQNCVTIAVVINFITQCELIKFYIRGIVQRFQERSVDLPIIMKEIFLLRQHLGTLNGAMAKMISFVSFVNLETTIIGVIMLALNKNDRVMVWSYRILFLVVAFLALIITMIQAAKTNSVSRRLMKQALEARVFGYKSSSQLDLDSFILFVLSTNLKVRVFHVAMSTTIVVVSFVALIVTIVILLQTNVIGNLL